MSEEEKMKNQILEEAGFEGLKAELIRLRAKNARLEESHKHSHELLEEFAGMRKVMKKKWKAPKAAEATDQEASKAVEACDQEAPKGVEACDQEAPKGTEASDQGLWELARLRAENAALVESQKLSAEL